MFILFFFSSRPVHRELPSFPTRRSSDLLLAEPHDRPFAELLFNLADGQVDRLGSLAVLTVVSLNGWHGVLLDLARSEEHTSELQSRFDLVCRLLLEKKKTCYTLQRYIGH